MSRFFKNTTILVLLVLLDQGCRSRENHSNTKIEPGSAATDGQFPSVFFLEPCTLVQIAERFFLTSASCAYSDDLTSVRPEWLKSKAMLQWGVDLLSKAKKKAFSKKVSVKSIYVHASFLKWRGPQNIGEEIFLELPSTVKDIALIELDYAARDFPRSKSTPVDVIDVAADKMVAVGYGRSQGLMGEQGVSTGTAIDRQMNWSTLRDVQTENAMFSTPSSELFGVSYVKLNSLDKGGPVFSVRQAGASIDQFTLVSVVAVSSHSDTKRTHFATLDKTTVDCIAKVLKKKTKGKILEPQSMCE